MRYISLSHYEEVRGSHYKRLDVVSMLKAMDSEKASNIDVITGKWTYALYW